MQLLAFPGTYRIVAGIAFAGRNAVVAAATFDGFECSALERVNTA
ncbi:MULTISPECIES: hypothetical protein [Chitinophaga]|nr:MULTISPECIES: hypothetical protein [Chitinophaga]